MLVNYSQSQEKELTLCLDASSKSGYYACASWSHIFAGRTESICRWVYSIAIGQLVAAQIKTGQNWQDLSERLRADLLESIHDNGSIEKPSDFNVILFATQEVPTFQQVEVACSKQSVLASNDYLIEKRDPSVKPEFPGDWMLVDKQDADGYAIVGDNPVALVLEAYAHFQYDHIEPIDGVEKLPSVGNSHAEKTTRFLALIEEPIRYKILDAIASDYGISRELALQEITDVDAESLLDYLKGDVRAATRVLMQRHAIV